MGLYDRDYARDQPRRLPPLASYSMVTILIVVTVAVFLADHMSPIIHVNMDGSINRWLSDHLSVQAGTLTHPLEWWRFLTAGFDHAPGIISHVGWNMFGLYLFGRGVEGIYGKQEFLRLYLALIVLSFVVWSAIELARGSDPQQTGALGASGAVAGITILFALHYPRQTLLLFFVIPVPAWIVAVGMVIMDLAGFTQPHGHVAYSAHLAGAAFAFAYYKWGGRLSSFGLGRFFPASRLRLRRRRLRVHDPGDSKEKKENLSDQVDRILEKISRQGEASLSRQERRTLEEASRRYQQRRL